jgi:hypothetical protein
MTTYFFGSCSALLSFEKVLIWKVMCEGKDYKVGKGWKIVETGTL